MATATKEKTLDEILSEEPQIVTVHVAIEGLPPGMYQGSKGLMEKQSGTIGKPKHLPPAEEARLRAHWCATGRQKNPTTPCIPWVCIFNSIVEAGKDLKIKGQGMKRWAGLLAAIISCPDDNIPLLVTEGKGFATFDVKEDWVRIPPKTGAMVKVGRPFYPKWRVEFDMNIDATYLDQDGIQTVGLLLVQAGNKIGLGPWRPQLKGPNGKFRVTQFDIEELA